jgi:hypothetical protein
MPTTPDLIKATMLFRGAIANSTAMIRRSILLENDFKYDETFESAAEDLDFWVRLSRITKLQNLNFPLIRYRVWERQATIVNSDSMSQNGSRVRLRLLEELGVERFNENIPLHEAIANNHKALNKVAVKSWFEEIVLRNKIHQIYDDKALNLVLEREYFNIFTTNSVLNHARVYRFTWVSHLLAKMPINLKIKIARMIGM